jgi:cyclic pyranopterin phosphate synthase
MLDALQRPMRDLRISVTDRCNLRCRYCMPREVFGPDHAFLPRAELLSFEEIARVAAVSAEHGVDRIRLTGGEPLLRRELPQLVEMLAAIPGIGDLSLTTNGLLMARHAATLADAGLHRVTVSLDALDPDVLREVADAPLDPSAVLGGIDAALAAGLDPVKVNMVVRRGLNDGEVLAMAERFRGSGCVLRFIEYMDVGTTNGWQREEVLPAAEILATIGQRWPLEPLAPTRPGEVASRYRYVDGEGEIGLIHAVTAPFCHGCTRARLSADGKLFTCLFAAEGLDLRTPLRDGCEDEKLAALIGGTWSARRDRYSAERAAQHEPAPERIEMSYIGG